MSNQLMITVQNVLTYSYWPYWPTEHKLCSMDDCVAPVYHIEQKCTFYTSRCTKNYHGMDYVYAWYAFICMGAFTLRHPFHITFIY